MGHASRKRRHDKRKAEKKARKAAKASLYKSYAEHGSKRRKKIGGGGVRGIFNHANTNCGNVGCKRCFQRLNGVANARF